MIDESTLLLRYVFLYNRGLAFARILYPNGLLSYLQPYNKERLFLSKKYIPILKKAVSCLMTGFNVSFLGSDKGLFNISQSMIAGPV